LNWEQQNITLYLASLSALFLAAVAAARVQAQAAGVKLQPSAELLELLGKADAFTFDVDSTL